MPQALALAGLFQASSPLSPPSRAGAGTRDARLFGLRVPRSGASHAAISLPRPDKLAKAAAMFAAFIKSFGALVLMEFLFSSLCADIAPTAFVGGGIIPKNVSSIKMRSAKVDIIWGAPCALKAVFEMENTTDEVQGVTVGFPVPAPNDTLDEDGKIPNSKSLGPLAMSFNGRKIIAATSVGEEGKTQNWTRNDWVWYYQNHDFAPGTTVVEVTTALRPSLTHGGPCREQLLYCIETGGRWAGAIAFEEVTIHFPDPLGRDQIDSIKPDGAEIDGNRVRWVFKDIEPCGEEYDIAITYVHPDAMRVITRLRDEYKRNPDSADAALKLARHLLALGDVKSNGGFPPWQLSEKEFRTVRDSIKSKEERRIFETHYARENGNMYKEKSSEWTDGRKRIIGILANAGYRDKQSVIPLILEAESLLNTLLHQDRHNADAWSVYLDNYWRFSFAAAGHWFGMTVFSKDQANKIQLALKNCPNDRRIQRWQRRLRGKESASPDPDMTRPGQMWKELEFPVLRYGYY